MSDQNTRRKFTKDEICRLLVELANELGRTPTLRDVEAKKNLPVKTITRLFGNYTKALNDCGLEAIGGGYRVEMTKLFEEWARVVRKLGKLPTVTEFGIHSRYSVRAPIHRFGQWSKVPAGMMQYAEENGLTAGWDDVVKIIKMKYPEGMKRASTSTTEDALTLKPKVHAGRQVYGTCASECLLVFAPTNEMGVIALFCSLALKLGFFILWIGERYPDCEVMREIEPGRWQRVLIEFEFYATNFTAHGHDAAKCDMLVCWENDWAKCPLEVLELKPYFFAAKGGGGKA